MISALFYILMAPQHGGDADVFTSNMYLAEDRVC